MNSSRLESESVAREYSSRASLSMARVVIPPVRVFCEVTCVCNHGVMKPCVDQNCYTAVMIINDTALAWPQAFNMLH